jgi:hypothetical protein
MLSSQCISRHWRQRSRNAGRPGWVYSTIDAYQWYQWWLHTILHCDKVMISDNLSFIQKSIYDQSHLRCFTEFYLTIAQSPPIGKLVSVSCKHS